MTKRLFSFCNPTDQLTCCIKNTALKQVHIKIRHVYLSVNLLNHTNTLSERPVFNTTKNPDNYALNIYQHNDGNPVEYRQMNTESGVSWYNAGGLYKAYSMPLRRSTMLQFPFYLRADWSARERDWTYSQTQTGHMGSCDIECETALE